LAAPLIFLLVKSAAGTVLIGDNRKFCAQKGTTSGFLASCAFVLSYEKGLIAKFLIA